MSNLQSASENAYHVFNQAQNSQCSGYTPGQGMLSYVTVSQLPWTLHDDRAQQRPENIYQLQRHLAPFNPANLQWQEQKQQQRLQPTLFSHSMHQSTALELASPYNYHVQTLTYPMNSPQDWSPLLCNESDTSGGADFVYPVSQKNAHGGHLPGSPAHNQDAMSNENVRSSMGNNGATMDAILAEGSRGCSKPERLKKNCQVLLHDAPTPRSQVVPVYTVAGDFEPSSVDLRNTYLKTYQQQAQPTLPFETQTGKASEKADIFLTNDEFSSRTFDAPSVNVSNSDDYQLVSDHCLQRIVFLGVPVAHSQTTATFNDAVATAPFVAINTIGLPIAFPAATAAAAGIYATAGSDATVESVSRVTVLDAEDARPSGCDRTGLTSVCTGDRSRNSFDEQATHHFSSFDAPEDNACDFYSDKDFALSRICTEVPGDNVPWSEDLSTEASTAKNSTEKYDTRPEDTKLTTEPEQGLAPASCANISGKDMATDAIFLSSSTTVSACESARTPYGENAHTSHFQGLPETSGECFSSPHDSKPQLQIGSAIQDRNDLRKPTADFVSSDWWFPSRKTSRFGILHGKAHRLRRRITSWSPPESRRERKLWGQVMSQVFSEKRRLRLVSSGNHKNATNSFLTPTSRKCNNTSSLEDVVMELSTTKAGGRLINHSFEPLSQATVVSPGLPNAKGHPISNSKQSANKYGKGTSKKANPLTPEVLSVNLCVPSSKKGSFWQSTPLAHHSVDELRLLKNVALQGDGITPLTLTTTNDVDPHCTPDYGRPLSAKYVVDARHFADESLKRLETNSTVVLSKAIDGKSKSFSGFAMPEVINASAVSSIRPELPVKTHNVSALEGWQVVPISHSIAPAQDLKSFSNVNTVSQQPQRIHNDASGLLSPFLPHPSSNRATIGEAVIGVAHQAVATQQFAVFADSLGNRIAYPVSSMEAVQSQLQGLVFQPTSYNIETNHLATEKTSALVPPTSSSRLTRLNPNLSLKGSDSIVGFRWQTLARNAGAYNSDNVRANSTTGKQGPPARTGSKTDAVVHLTQLHQQIAMRNNQMLTQHHANASRSDSMRTKHTVPQNPFQSNFADNNYRYHNVSSSHWREGQQADRSVKYRGNGASGTYPRAKFLSSHIDSMDVKTANGWSPMYPRSAPLDTSTPGSYSAPSARGESKKDSILSSLRGVWGKHQCSRDEGAQNSIASVVGESRSCDVSNAYNPKCNAKQISDGVSRLEVTSMRPSRKVTLSPQPFFSFWYPQPNLERTPLEAISRVLSCSIRHFVASVECEVSSKNGPLRQQLIHSVKDEILRFIRKSPTASKYLPPKSLKTRDCLDVPFVDVLPYGSSCSNLFLPWSDIDLTIVGLQVPATTSKQSDTAAAVLRPNFGHPLNFAAACNISDSSSTTSSSNEASLAPASGATLSLFCHQTGSNLTNDSRYEILQHMADFFDKYVDRDHKLRKSNQALKCRTDLMHVFTSLQYKPSRHTPLLTLNFQLSAEGCAPIASHLDISVHSPGHTGIEAVRILKAIVCPQFYSAFFPTMRPLILVLKQMLQRRQMNVPYEGGLSSYALSLMIIAFLQSPQLYSCRMDDLGFQLLNFLAFYGDISVPSHGVICLRPHPTSRTISPSFGSLSNNAQSISVNGESVTSAPTGQNSSQGVAIKSFNYHNIAISVLTPEEFVQGPTFRKCLRLIEGCIGAQSGSSEGSLWLSPSLLQATASPPQKFPNLLWPAVQEVHPPAPTCPTEGSCTAEVPDVVPVDRKGAESGKSKLTYAAVARTRNGASSGNSSASRRRRGKSAEDILNCRVENLLPNIMPCSSINSANSEVSNAALSMETPLSARNGVIELQQAELTTLLSSELQAVAAKVQPSDVFSTKELALKKSLATSQTSCQSIYQSLEDLSPKVESEEPLSSVNVEVFEVPEAILRDKMNSSPAEQSADLSDKCILESAIRISEKTLALTPAEACLPGEALLSSQSCIPVVSSCSSLSCPVPEPKSLKLATAQPSTSLSLPFPHCTSNDTVLNGSLDGVLSPLEGRDSTCTKTSLEKSSSSDFLVDEPIFNEMFEFLSPFAKTETFLGYRLEIRDPADLTNNVGRPSFNVSGIKMVFANAFWDLLRISGCSSCTSNGKLSRSDSSRPRYHLPLDFKGLPINRIEAWSLSARRSPSDSTPSLNTNSTPYANFVLKDSRGCSNCCGVLRAIL